MYIVERIIGISTYLILMFIFSMLIYRSSSKNKLRNYLILYWISLCILSFFYVPAYEHDLTRLLPDLIAYRKLSLSAAFPKILKTTVPMKNIYFYFISKLQFDGFLPGISGAWFYANCFIVLYKFSKKYEIDNKNVALSLIFFMIFGQIVEVISGIRSMLAFSIISVCIYTEIIENRSILKNMFFYAIAALLHPAGVVLAALRFVIYFFTEKSLRKKAIYTIAILAVVVLAFIVKKDLIEYVIRKSKSYLSHEVYSYIWEYIIGWIYVLFSSFILYKNRRYIKENKEIYSLNNFMIVFNIIIIIFSIEYSIFHRFSIFAGTLFLPLYSFYLQKRQNESKLKREFDMKMLLIVGTMVLVLVATRGNLCGYKFFEL